jgi:hypothetical protein
MTKPRSPACRRGWLHRLIEIDILVHENRGQIIETLGGESRDQILADLHRVREAFRHAKREFQACEERVETVMSAVGKS